MKAPILPDTALLERLNAELLRHDSATLTLERWCAERGFPSVEVRAELIPIDLPADAAVHRRLRAGRSRVRFRRVRLHHAGTVLSEADNWYLPSVLTPEMNRALEESDVPFGPAVQALDFRRRTLLAEILWQPGTPTPPAVLRHHALLLLPDETPFSEVVETYTAALLQAF